MKKILFVLALVASMQVANAQTKSPSAAKSAVDAAKAAVENVKKNTKSTTWIKYGQALLDAYSAPAGNLWNGMTDKDLQLVGNEKATGEEQVEIQGQPMIKKIYANKNLYFDNSGVLAITEVTQPVVEGALDKAIEAFKKATELDNGAKSKDIAAGLKTIVDKLNEEAVNNYGLGKFDVASACFEKAFAASQLPKSEKIDTASAYNAGLTAMLGGNYERAKDFFKKSLDFGYDGEDGETFAKLGDVYDKLGDKDASKDVYEKGFSKYPQSQGILVGLINYYVNSGENTDRLFELLDGAKKNEPGNASLYYVEGNIHSKLGEEADAVASWDKCSEINPDYEFGFIGKGLYYYNKAADIQNAASTENDDAKYMALMQDFDKYLKACVEPLEKGYELCKDQETKGNIASYLKSVCFILREDAAYQSKYEKYSAIAQ